MRETRTRCQTINARRHTWTPCRPPMARGTRAPPLEDLNERRSGVCRSNKCFYLPHADLATASLRPPAAPRHHSRATHPIPSGSAPSRACASRAADATPGPRSRAPTRAASATPADVVALDPELTDTSASASACRLRLRRSPPGLLGPRICRVARRTRGCMKRSKAEHARNTRSIFTLNTPPRRVGRASCPMNVPRV